MLQAVFRVLRHGGRLVLCAISDHTSVQIGSIMRIFRRLRLLIWRIFGPPEAVVAVLETTGFVAVTVER